MSWQHDSRTSSPAAAYAELRRDYLSQHERTIFDAWSDSRGIVQNRDVDALLRKVIQLRQLLSDVIEQAGHPRRDRYGRCVAAVPTAVLEDADAEAVYPGRSGDDDWDPDG
jgi:hypothetical protein